MPTLVFTLVPEGVVRIHDAMLCLAKFSDTIGLEARRDQVGFSLQKDRRILSNMTLRGG